MGSSASLITVLESIALGLIDIGGIARVGDGGSSEAFTGRAS